MFQDQKTIGIRQKSRFSEKIENVQEKYQCWSPSVMLTCDFIKTGVCLLSQIIIFLIGLRRGNCPSVIGEIL